MNVAPRFFELLGVEPAMDRRFDAAEYVPNSPPAVLVTHGYWQRRLGANPGIAGTHVTIDDQPVLVAGVLPASFDFASAFTPGTRVDFFKLAVLEQMREWGNTLTVIARLKPGVSIDAARAELDVVGPAMKQAQPTLFSFGTRVTA